MTRPTAILHFTSGRNLRAIAQAGELVCKRRLDGIAITNLAHTNIQDRRATTVVPCGPRGHLHDFVPFYFAPRSPMLYAIKSGRVAGADPNQDVIVYLESSVEAVVDAKLPFVFTDGHGAMELTEFFDDPADLHAIDWPLMRERIWANTDDDGDRTRRRQAEFLVHGAFPWILVTRIVVKTRGARVAAERALRGLHAPPVDIEPSWYF